MIISMTNALLILNLGAVQFWRGITLVLVFGLALIHCNNYDLLNQLENPGGVSGEIFADRFYAFVSSWQTTGDMANQPYSECSAFTGVAKADCACTKAAAANNLRKNSQHEFKAFLGLPGAPVYDPPCRSVGYPAGCATNILSPWYNTRDAVIFNAHSSAAFGTSIQNPIRYSEQKADMVSGAVWTGSSGLGGYTNACPSNWVVADTTIVNVGDFSQTTTSWEFITTAACNTQARIYCFATSPP